MAIDMTVVVDGKPLIEWLKSNEGFVRMHWHLNPQKSFPETTLATISMSEVVEKQ